MSVILEPPIRNWYCPSCHLTDQTKGAQYTNRWHSCSKHGGLKTPMLPAGVKGKHVSVMRQDYVGKELVRLDDAGRPVMNITTTRDEGQDCTVFCPTARAHT
ncbi:MAG: hypothetical protein V2A79_03745 [Planctomycetota bacterium]